MTVINSYLLAADPAWIEPSVLSYYDIVKHIFVSYDRTHRSWTGNPIPVEHCLDRLRAIDRDRKMVWVAGDFARPGYTPMENDSHQRSVAFEQAGRGADWVLQLDSDEVLPNPHGFAEHLTSVAADATGVEWPMRIMYKQVGPDRFLEVRNRWWRQYSEYPGCAAIRSLAKLRHCRHPHGRLWRVGVRRPWWVNLWRREVADYVIPGEDAIIHFSWARTEADLRSKLKNWSHSDEFDGVRYLEHVWKRADYRWPVMSELHPIKPWLWPALWPTTLSRKLTHGYRTDTEGSAALLSQS